MSQIVDYLIHDPVGNVEGQLGDYDPVRLEEAEKNGMVFIAVMDDGERRLVKAADVSEPKQQNQYFTVAKPEYVDERTKATVAVFDAVAAIIDPQPATADESGEAAQQADPVETFRSALAALRALEEDGRE
ncbi:hypothetical protein [Collinsella sp. AF38-3AC]|uniref:hypothetical protein n=1 Tax=Collinsella sp. AF38-3AC TaxID=2292015 RepID=UPI000E4A0D5E|nr:hypothetical protein [Collinsella sp. AF38-3AC]RHL22111.1 hypothetical protein DW029_09420 [Collinsella sp. AF38-3AC]